MPITLFHASVCTVIYARMRCRVFPPHPLNEDENNHLPETVILLISAIIKNTLLLGVCCNLLYSHCRQTHAIVKSTILRSLSPFVCRLSWYAIIECFHWSQWDFGNKLQVARETDWPEYEWPRGLQFVITEPTYSLVPPPPRKKWAPLWMFHLHYGHWQWHDFAQKVLCD